MPLTPEGDLVRDSFQDSLFSVTKKKNCTLPKIDSESMVWILRLKLETSSVDSLSRDTERVAFQESVIHVTTP
jgi:hypothetical protein